MVPSSPETWILTTTSADARERSSIRLIEGSVRTAARDVFRTDVHHPGFAHLVLRKLSISSEEFAEMVAELAQGLAEPL